MMLTLLLCACLQSTQPTSESAPAEDPLTLRVLVLGDDHAAASRDVSRPWPERLAEILEARVEARIEVENVALRGDTTVTGLRRLRRDVLVRDPDLVFLHYGFQDAFVDLSGDEDFPRVAPGAFRSNLADLISAARGAGAEVVLVQPGALVWADGSREHFGAPPFDLDESFGLDRLNIAYAGIARDIAADLDAPLIALHDSDRLRGEEAVRGMRVLDGQRGGMLLNGAGHTWVAGRAADVATEFARSAPLARLSEHAAPSLGWTIPEIDLSATPGRVIVVDREDGQYLGHPTTEVMDDGTILCVYPKGHGRGPIVMKRSVDGGRTWSERLPTPSTWSGSKEVPTLFRVALPKSDGPDNIVLWSGLYPARRALSTDGGTTWSELELPWSDNSGGPFGGIVVMADLAQVMDGSSLAWFHDDGRFLTADGGARGFGVFQTRSGDGGVTWSAPREIARSAHAHYCEPGLLRQGGTMALLLRENSRRRNSAVILSTDDGDTWSEPRPVSGALTGDRHQAVELPDGRFFISFRDTGLDSPRYGDWVGWVGSFEDAVSGRQGDARVFLMDNHVRADCAYPALEVLVDGTILATTYGHWTPGESPWIAALRIDPAELMP